MIIVLATERGITSGEIGVMAAMLGVGGVVGSLIAPYLQRRLSPYASRQPPAFRPKETLWTACEISWSRSRDASTS